MRDAATLLLALIDAGERAITRPTIGATDQLAALHVELQEAVTLTPDPDGGLLIDVEALLLAQVITLAAQQRGDRRHAALLQQLAGVLLPAVRQAASRAIEVRRDTRATP